MTKSLEHFDYLSDRVKLKRYQSAIEQVVRPHHVVLDLGCGSGVLGLMALRAGASKVFFVQHDSVIDVARKTVANAGFADKAEFFQANSFELTLPEPGDVAVCDHVGYFGFDYGILDLLADARARLMKPDGIIVPQQITLKLAPIASETCRNIVGRWRDGSVPDDYEWQGLVAANAKHPATLKAKNLLADATALSTLQLGADVPPFLSWQIEFEIERDGTLDGLAGWFECQLFGDVSMTNSPTASAALDRPQAFLPLKTPVAVSKGDQIEVTLMVRPADHVINWIVKLPGTNQRFEHSTFNSLPLDDQLLTRLRQDRVATLNNRGRARQIVLSYCDGQRTVAEIQALVLQDHPNLFPSAQATSGFVNQVLTWDTGE